MNRTWQAAANTGRLPREGYMHDLSGFIDWLLYFTGGLSIGALLAHGLQAFVNARARKRRAKQPKLVPLDGQPGNFRDRDSGVVINIRDF